MLKAGVSSLLSNILDEVNNWDPGMFPINTKPQCSHEVDLAVVTDETLRKMYQLHLFYTREANRAGADLSVAPDDLEIQKTFNRASDRAEMLRVLFWHLVSEKHELWEHPNTGLRKDWQVVKVHNNHGPEAFIQRLMGGEPPR